MKSDEIKDIDYSNCLIYQKLEFIQFCIMHQQKQQQQNDDDDDEDQCRVSQEEEEEEEQGRVLQEDHISTAWDINLNESQIINDEENIKIYGRKSWYKQLYLYKHSDIKLYEPYTQQNLLMTYDIFQAHETLLSNLNTEERLQLQIKSLSSDISSFKAANPQAIFIDFIRWYSPNDIVQEQLNQQISLSKRMMKENNLWLQLWNKTIAKTANQQDSLFSTQIEVEKALNYLHTLSFQQVISQLYPIAFHHIFLSLYQIQQQLNITFYINNFNLLIH